MEQQQSLLKSQIKQQQRTTINSPAASPRICSNCGTPYHDGDKFCEECGKPLSAAVCPYCGMSVQPHWEICPSCGHNLLPDQCSFCGASVDKEDAFCPDCGNPRAGIVCPDCGTLNFRSFCRKCNRPLDDTANAELAKAQRDPVFRQMVELAEELATLEEQLTQQDASHGDTHGASHNASTDTPSAPPPSVEMSEADKALLERYKALFSGQEKLAPALAPIPAPAATPTPQPRRESKIKISIAQPEQAPAAELYKAKVEEMKRLMEKLRPEGDMTPQMQRNYYSARKLPVIKKTVTKVPAYWICNLCHARHLQPSECAQPQLGGEWVYDDIITAHRVFEYEE
jgi:predicted amidophosphoribosyltransferase